MNRTKNYVISDIHGIAKVLIYKSILKGQGYRIQVKLFNRDLEYLATLTMAGFRTLKQADAEYLKNLDYFSNAIGFHAVKHERQTIGRWPKLV